MTRKKYQSKLSENLVAGYLSAVSGLEGKKKVYLEPVTIHAPTATVKDCAFLGAATGGDYGLMLKTGD